MPARERSGYKGGVGTYLFFKKYPSLKVKIDETGIRNYLT